MSSPKTEKEWDLLNWTLLKMQREEMDDENDTSIAWAKQQIEIVENRLTVDDQTREAYEALIAAKNDAILKMQNQRDIDSRVGEAWEELRKRQREMMKDNVLELEKEKDKRWEEKVKEEEQIVELEDTVWKLEREHMLLNSGEFEEAMQARFAWEQEMLARYGLV